MSAGKGQANYASRHKADEIAVFFAKEDFERLLRGAQLMRFIYYGQLNAIWMLQTPADGV
ncbi:MAG: hypothetical protein FRX49_01070 [Trebouxia sp. A1-2]|nr:MAG: hypothetical protein FRX49_01070 [Trebouxia sp. A1-2]